MERLIEPLFLYFAVDKIEKAIFGLEGNLVKENLQASVEVGIVPYPLFNHLKVKAKILKDVRIGNKFDVCAGLVATFSCLLIGLNALFKACFCKLAFANRAHQKVI